MCVSVCLNIFVELCVFRIKKKKLKSAKNRGDNLLGKLHNFIQIAKEETQQTSEQIKKDFSWVFS